VFALLYSVTEFLLEEFKLVEFSSELEYEASNFGTGGGFDDESKAGGGEEYVK
jgi:hypothetical protein